MYWAIEQRTLRAKFHDMMIYRNRGCTVEASLAIYQNISVFQYHEKLNITVNSLNRNEYSNQIISFLDSEAILLWWNNMKLQVHAHNLGAGRAACGVSHSVTMWFLVISFSERQPLNAIVSSNSSRNICSTFFTPASPSAANEKTTGLPICENHHIKIKDWAMWLPI